MSKLVKDETKRLLEVIQEQIENLLSHENQIPIIEIDLTKESIRKLYQQLDYLAKPLDKNEELEKIINKTNRETESILDKADMEFHDKEEKPEPKTDDKAKAEIEKSDEKESSKDSFKAKEGIKETENNEAKDVQKQSAEEEKSKQKPIEESSFEGKTIVENPAAAENQDRKEKKAQRSIIDVVASEEETNLGDAFQESNINNLKSAIGINDKFQFINELFEGSMSNYNAFIKKVDSLEEKEAAINEFEAAKQENNWNKEDGAYQLMENYIKRRFG